VDDTGKLAGITVLSQTGDRAGGVLNVPLTTVPELTKVPLDKTFADAGQAGIVAAVQGLLGVGMEQVQVTDPTQWASLLAPVGPLAVTNPEAVDVPGVGSFPKGPITLEPGQVGAFLGAPSPSGDDQNRLRRNDAFWQALFTRLAGQPVQLPGEADQGLTKFLPGLAKTQVAVETLPVTPVPTPDRRGVLFVPDAAATQALVGRLIPFPIEATPGGRVKTRILDGTGQLDHGVGAAPALVRAGGQITGIGNAANFNYPTTQVIYYDDARREAADALRAALGVGELVKSADPTHDVDVTVILGRDYASRPAPSNDTVVTSPPTGLGTVPVTTRGGTGG
jgi:hypothetical protein